MTNEEKLKAIESTQECYDLKESLQYSKNDINGNPRMTFNVFQLVSIEELKNNSLSQCELIARNRVRKLFYNVRVTKTGAINANVPYYGKKRIAAMIILDQRGE